MSKRVNLSGSVKNLREKFFNLTGIYISRQPTTQFQQYLAPNLSVLLSLVAQSCRRPLSIVQVGAYDGVSFDPLPAFIKTNSHHITLVEPNPHVIRQLKFNYEGNPLAQVIEAAVGESDNGSSMRLFYFADELVSGYPDFGATSSLSEAHLLDAFQRNRHRFPQISNVESLILTVDVPLVSAKTVISNHGSNHLDLLLIDAEGADWEILQQFDLDEIEISMVQIEHRFLDSLSIEGLLSHMHKHGYRMFELGNDLLCIKES